MGGKYCGLKTYKGGGGASWGKRLNINHLCKELVNIIPII